MSEAILEYNLKMDMHINSLKVQQISALNCLTDSKDCICSLPTGYGKSLIYELLLFVDKGCLVVVVVPLNAILNQQLAKLGDLAVSLCPGKSDINSLKSGNYCYLFCQILDNRSLNDVFWAQDHKTKAGDQTQSQASDWLKWRPVLHKAVN
jgi:superfamily II DNA helicase RecQ